MYNAKGTKVELTMCGGEILMEEKKVKHLNEQEIKDNCYKTIKKIS